MGKVNFALLCITAIGVVLVAFLNDGGTIPDRTAIILMAVAYLIFIPNFTYFVTKNTRKSGNSNRAHK